MFQALGDDSAGQPHTDRLIDYEVRDVVVQAQQGDTAAFSSLFQQYNGPICTYLARLVGNSEVGRDLAQETFLKAWKSLPELSNNLHFRAWLYRIATNVANSHLRRAKLIRWLPWLEQEENTPRQLRVAGPEEQMGESDSVERTLSYLSPQCRTCLLLQLVGGFSQREIAEMLGISESSVGAYVSRGREQFRKVYQSLKGAEV